MEIKLMEQYAKIGAIWEKPIIRYVMTHRGKNGDSSLFSKETWTSRGRFLPCPPNLVYATGKVHL